MYFNIYSYIDFSSPNNPLFATKYIINTANPSFATRKTLQNLTHRFTLPQEDNQIESMPLESNIIKELQELATQKEIVEKYDTNTAIDLDSVKEVETQQDAMQDEDIDSEVKIAKEGMPQKSLNGNFVNKDANNLEPLEDIVNRVLSTSDENDKNTNEQSKRISAPRYHINYEDFLTHYNNKKLTQEERDILDIEFRGAKNTPWLSSDEVRSIKVASHCKKIVEEIDKTTPEDYLKKNNDFALSVLSVRMPPEPLAKLPQDGMVVMVKIVVNLILLSIYSIKDGTVTLNPNAKKYTEQADKIYTKTNKNVNFWLGLH